MDLTVFALFALGAGFPKATASHCGNASTGGPLSFQTSYDGATIPIALLAGTRVELACCSRSFTDIVWTLNGRPLASYHDNFTLQERHQVVVTPLTPPTGNYSCIVSNATASIRNFFILSVYRIDESCRLGSVGSVVQPPPPEVNYRTHLGYTVQLKCAAVIYCGGPSLVNRVQWWKINAEGNYDVYYDLYQGAEVDALTGDYVNVSWRYSDTPRKALFVESILTIRNVKVGDLYVSKPFPPNCGSSRSKCILEQSSTIFQCSIILEESDDPSQSNYSLQSTVKLHPNFRCPGVDLHWRAIGSKNTRLNDTRGKRDVVCSVPSFLLDDEPHPISTATEVKLVLNQDDVSAATSFAMRLLPCHLWISMSVFWTLLW